MIPKFRAYHKELKMMFEVKSLVYTLRLARLTNRNDLVPSRTCSFDEIILMQYTGLKDKNGVEVFEGDIVIAWSQGVKGAFEIKRRIDGLWLLYPAWKDGQFWYLSPTEDGRETIEIIGNIYENPDLLESVEE
ncbi:YopX family protein [Streptococcus uberis]|uniref:YopX family protein n=1 Tax=Streptococcus uberis TaxID=1349 RepID=UPI0006202F79|nr:YopX family protein [Streptococcus uberis]KKF55655.1 hypothetical protein AF66_02605 [Streptococcus uberis B190]